MSQQAMRSALPMVHCLALCLAVLVGSGECMAVSLVEQHQVEPGLIEAGLLAPSRVPARGSGHDVAKKEKPSFLHRLLAAIEVKGMAIPPEIIETIQHKKVAGNGYAKGSPLYARYEEFKNASAIASLTKEASPHDPGSPSYPATALMVVLSMSCIGGAHLLAGNSGHVPNKDITAGPIANKSMIPHSEASLEESMHVPYGGGGRPSFQHSASMPPSMSPAMGSMHVGGQPFGTSLQPGAMPPGSTFQPGSLSLQQPQPHGTGAPVGISSFSAASNRSRSPMARPGSPGASSQSPSQVGYPSMGHVLSPPQSHASQPQVHGSWHSLPTQAMPTQPMPVSPIHSQAQPLSPVQTGSFGN